VLLLHLKVNAVAFNQFYLFLDILKRHTDQVDFGDQFYLLGDADPEDNDTVGVILWVYELLHEVLDFVLFGIKAIVLELLVEYFDQ
jgi:hypothetical protein